MSHPAVCSQQLSFLFRVMAVPRALMGLLARMACVVWLALLDPLDPVVLLVRR